MMATVLAEVRLVWLFAMLLACASTRPESSMAIHPEGRVHAMRADLVLRGGVIVTGVPGQPHADAIAVGRGKVLRIGDGAAVEALIDSNTVVHELAGAVVLPGLVDAHAHLAELGAALESVDLAGARSYEEVVARVVAAAAKTPSAWILGRGWDQNDWDSKAFPDGNEFEAALPGRAVWLERIDGHAGLASPAALAAAGVTPGTPDPPGGKIIKDAGAKPTGVLVDGAMRLVDAVVPPPSAGALSARLSRALATAAAAGLTGVHDMGVGAAALEILEQLDAAGDLPVRVYAVLDGRDPKLDQLLARGPRQGERLTVRAVKLYADGALGSRGAALLSDYSDDPGNTGLMVTEPPALEAAVARASAAGFQLCIHAIGDRGNRAALDAIAKAHRPQLRPRIEHAQVVAPADIPRFAQLAVVASMQPTHATSDMPWAEARLGAGRLAGAYAWRKLLDAGATLAFGSDFPVERPEVLEGLYAALTRQDKDGKPEGGWLPRERLDFSAALAAFTTGAAYASFTDTRRGLLTPGQDADMTVVVGTGVAELVGGTGSARALLDARVSLTVVGGKVSYARFAPAASSAAGF